MRIMTEEDPRWREFQQRLEKAVEQSSCDSTVKRPLSRRILRSMGYDVPASLEHFDSHGGMCDCEILWNVESRGAHSHQNQKRSRRDVTRIGGIKDFVGDIRPWQGDIERFIGDVGEHTNTLSFREIADVDRFDKLVKLPQDGSVGVGHLPEIVGLGQPQWNR